MVNKNKKIIFKKKFFKIYSSKIKRNKIIKSYDVIDFGPRVGIVMVKNNKILLTKQYRYLIDKYSIEIPGGSVKKGESYYNAAKREAFEETGFYVKNLKKILTYYPGLDNVDNITTIFLTESFMKSKINFSPNFYEIESIDWYPIEMCLNLIKKKKILDIMTIAALLKIGNKIL